jgi:hypothetical protein
MAAEIHVGDIGLTFRVTIKDQDSNVVNLSETLTKQIILNKPNGEILTKNATFYTDGTDGIIEYVTVEGDLDTQGIWKIQGYVVFETSEFRTNKESFWVYND